MVSHASYKIPYDTIAEYFIPPDVHDLERVNSGEGLLALVLALVWTVLHALNAYLVFVVGMPFLYGLIIHALLTVVIAAIARVARSIGGNIRHLFVLSVASGGAGVFGAAGSLLSILLTVFYNNFALPFSDWYRTIFPHIDATHEEALYEMITSGKDEHPRSYHVSSFHDIMKLGSEAQKRRALSRMTDHFHPSFAPAYKMALRDPSNAIRVQAASSAAKIENEFSAMLMHVERLEVKHPNDARVKLGLARFYDGYAFTGLLDKDREDENRIKALQKFKEYLEMKPSDIDARIEAGRLLLRSGDYAQVIALFNDCMEAGYGSDTLKLWMLEALYAAGRYSDLRRMAQTCLPMIGKLREAQPNLARSVEFWGGASA
jgi:polysaccharide biosynthesis protein PelE